MAEEPEMLLVAALLWLLVMVMPTPPAKDCGHDETCPPGKCLIRGR